jgi:hypothetical protein
MLLNRKMVQTERLAVSSVCAASSMLGKLSGECAIAKHSYLSADVALALMRAAPH